LYGNPLLLPEEVMEEPLWKIARFPSETGLGNEEAWVVQRAKPKCQVSKADPLLKEAEEKEE